MHVEVITVILYCWYCRDDHGMILTLISEMLCIPPILDMTTRPFQSCPRQSRTLEPSFLYNRKLHSFQSRLHMYINTGHFSDESGLLYLSILHTRKNFLELFTPSWAPSQTVLFCLVPSASITVVRAVSSTFCFSVRVTPDGPCSPKKPL